MAGDGLEFEAGSLKAFKSKIEALRSPEVMNQVFDRSLYPVAADILEDAEALCPVDTGALRRSGHVEGPYQGPEGREVAIVYGGAAAPYAWDVHERLDVKHNPPTQAKYLEKPFHEHQDDVRRRLTLELARVLRQASS